MPEIIDDLSRNRQLRPIIGREPAQRKNIEERAAGEQYDEKNPNQETWNCIAYHDGARSPYIEVRAILDRFADAKRYRDQIGQQGEPEAERDRDRQLLLDEL